MECQKNTNSKEGRENGTDEHQQIHMGQIEMQDGKPKHKPLWLQ